MEERFLKDTSWSKAPKKSRRCVCLSFRFVSFPVSRAVDECLQLVANYSLAKTLDSLTKCGSIHNFNNKLYHMLIFFFIFNLILTTCEMCPAFILPLALGWLTP